MTTKTSLHYKWWYRLLVIITGLTLAYLIRNNITEYQNINDYDISGLVPLLMIILTFIISYFDKIINYFTEAKS